MNHAPQVSDAEINQPDDQKLHLSPAPPRVYPTIEAFRGRVWRNRYSLYAKELALLAGAGTLYGFLLDHREVLILGTVIFLFVIVFSGLALLIVNLRRRNLIRTAPAVKGTLTRTGRALFWHEMFRAKAHRSFWIEYTYTPTDSDREITGRLYLCQCASKRLKTSDKLWITYHAHKPSRSIPLRVAVMRIPH